MKCVAVFNLVVVCDAAGLSRKCLTHVCDYSHVIKLVLPESQILHVRNRWELLSLRIVIRQLRPFILTLSVSLWLACSSRTNSDVNWKYLDCCNWWENRYSVVYLLCLTRHVCKRQTSTCLSFHLHVSGWLPLDRFPWTDSCVGMH